MNNDSVERIHLFCKTTFHCFGNAVPFNNRQLTIYDNVNFCLVKTS